MTLNSDGRSSPLMTAGQTPFPEAEFRPFESNADLEALRWRMNHALFALFEAELPPSSRDEAISDVCAYTDSHDFFSLFYPPVWSFLHWAQPPVAAENAMQAQAFALFLHLWDDHLSDGQLGKRPLRAQMRAIAWRSFVEHCSALATVNHAPPGLVDDHASAYTGTINAPRDDRSISDYCDRFRTEIAIWTVVPFISGFAEAGVEAGRSLVEIVERFGIAWRLVDDLEDLEEDVAAGAASAVRLLLDAGGRTRWDRCRSDSTGRGTEDPIRFRELIDHIEANGHVGVIVALVREQLRTASDMAEQNGWAGLARELSECAPAAMR